MKETILLVLLSIILPSFDVYSDLALIVKFYIGSRYNPYCDQEFQSGGIELFDCHYDNTVPTTNLTYTPHHAWGTMMLVPFLLNYLICWYVWATTDKRKAVTWVAVLLGFFPQYVACKVIYQIWSDPKKGLQKKRQLERDLIQMETFLEAVPSSLVMTYLLGSGAVGHNSADGGELIFNARELGSYELFIVAFSTSVITSSLGLAKTLKVGPCRILPMQKKYLGGLLSPRFVLIFFACGLTFVGKGAALALAFLAGEVAAAYVGIQAGAGVVRAGAAIAVSTCFLPGLLLSLFSCWHRGILKTFLAQPSVFLLPVFSHFTFVSRSNEENGKTEVEDRKQETEVEDRKQESFISYSPKYTAVNAGGSIAGILLNFFIFAHFSRERSLPLFGYVIFGLPISILGLLLTLVVAFSNQCNCCKCWCCSCCSEPFQFGALLASSPHTSYIVGPGGELITDTEENKEKEMQEALEMGVSTDNRGFVHSTSTEQAETEESGF